ncbi:MAG: hypothetical protein ACLPRE_01335, partial [Limisphaerales bacterium]
GFAGQFSASQKPFASLSSPGGEDTGEGERQNKIHSPIVHPKMNSGKESVAHAEFELRSAERNAHPLITPITQISFPASAESADKTSRDKSGRPVHLRFV